MLSYEAVRMYVRTSVRTSVTYLKQTAGPRSSSFGRRVQDDKVNSLSNFPIVDFLDIHLKIKDSSRVNFEVRT